MPKTTAENKTTPASAGNHSEPNSDLMDQDAEEEEYATYFIVVADTSEHYHELHHKMTALSNRMKIPTDTMGRYYNTEKNLIMLPEDDEDEIYAGDYFRRRFASEHFSMEYLNFYTETAGEKTIALLSGIYETEETARQALKILQKHEPKAYFLSARIYTGCMH